MTAAQPFVMEDRVRWGDVDLVGIMRFSAFTRLVEVAEQELMRDAGIPFKAAFDAPTVWMPRRHLSIDYFAPARIDDALTLVMYVSRLGDTSATFQVDVRLPERDLLIAAAALVVVCVSVATFEKRALSLEYRTALTPYLCSVESVRLMSPPPARPR